MNSGAARKKIPPAQTEAGQSLLCEKSWFYIAAAACVLLVAGFVFSNELIYRLLISGNGHISSFQLSDGTRVVLNANSVLKVPRLGFGNGNREVMLEGEAEFKVVHTEKPGNLFATGADGDFSLISSSKPQQHVA